MFLYFIICEFLYILCFLIGDLVWMIVKGLFEVLFGIVYGCILGICLWFILVKNSVSGI